MMRFCPKCGDYYADDLLAFCPADGAPLVGVDANSERWTEGQRVIEEKQQALTKRKRKLRLLRISSFVTMLIVTMVVYGLMARRYVYLVPAAAPSPVPVSSPTPLPAELLSPSPSRSPSPTPTIAIKETPTPTIAIKETPTPTIVIKETPTPTIVIKETPTPTIVIKETPTPTIVIKETPTPTIVIKTPTPTIVIKETPTIPECSESDRSHASETILGRYRDTFERRIKGERNKIIAKFPDGAVPATAELGPVEYQIAILNQCMVAAVRARYVWRVSSPTKALTQVPGEKRFTCVKIPGGWLCP